MSHLKPVYLEFWMDGERFAVRRGIGGFPDPESCATPMVGDEVLLNGGSYIVTNRIWDFVSEDKSQQGLRLVIKKAKKGKK